MDSSATENVGPVERATERHLVTWETVGGLGGKVIHYCKHTSKHTGRCRCQCGVWADNKKAPILSDGGS